MTKVILLENILDFSNKSWPRSKKENQNTLDSINLLYKGQEVILNAFRSGILPIKTQGKGLKR